MVKEKVATRGKRLPRAIREQQMLDSALKVFSLNGFHQASMDAIAKEAAISKPMLYLYYGSKDELFAACLHRESGRFLEAISKGGDPSLSPRETLEVTLGAVLEFVDEHRDAWRVLVREASSVSAFAQDINQSRETLVGLTADLLRAGTKEPDEGQDFELMAVALVGAGEAVANRVAEGGLNASAATDAIMGLAWLGLSGRKKES
ncbi:TetR/AcrR family transcriptional regulator [Tomitella biformata]|uniref:TetR/AcrR family transcriptional regulator n=1 Tax=Tomitella biformata TaxID=630403 RepID=UPI0004635CAA|nr:TetR/AcrR family transcriptional regulator [Tomitella biformata]